MIFTGPRFTAAASGGIIAGGTVTSVDVPQVFSWAAGPPPPSYGHGTWQIGTQLPLHDGTAESARCRDHQHPVRYRHPGYLPPGGLEVEGPASAPSFLCEYPDPANTCTFRKIS
jgi:hypothetical protein